MDSQLVPVAEVIQKMAQNGMHVESISQILNVPAITVRQVVLQLPPHQHPDEVKIAEETRSLVKIALDEARQMFEYGTMDVKLALVKQFIGIAGRTMGKADADTETEDTRAAVERIFASQREIPTMIPEG